VQKKSRLNKRL